MMELQPGSSPDGKTGVSGFVLFFGGAVLVGLGVALGAFLFSSPDRSVGDRKITGVVSETFRDVLGLKEERQPVLEIDLAAEEAESVIAKEAEPAIASDPPAETPAHPAEGSVDAGAKQSAEEKEPNLPPPDCDFGSGGVASRKVVFNEIAWMGTTLNANDEWIELKNNSAGEVDLSGWQLLSKDGRIKFRFPDTVLKPGEFFLLERTDDESLPDIKADAIYTGLLPNSGSSLRLFDAGCGLADEIDASGGWTAFGGDRVARKTLERDSGGLGWHTSSVVGGTPGSENSAGAEIASAPAAGGGSATTSVSEAKQSQNISGKININTAGLEELDKITGVGPKIAQRIIDYRNANGPFQRLEDLKNVKGIGDVNFEKMRDEITL